MKRRELTNQQISNAILGVALIATGAALVIAAENKSPGITFVVLAGIRLTVEHLVDAFRWVAAFAALVYGGYRFGAYVTRRDVEQELAQKTARDQQAPRILPIGKN